MNNDKDEEFIILINMIITIRDNDEDKDVMGILLLINSNEEE